MKLFYYKDEIGNFGDDLNPWLWDKLLPDYFDNDDSEYLVGIGTLINDKLPKDKKKIIFGSGYGYGKLPVIDETYNFLAVRGPKTAEILGLNPNLAVTDSAILVRTVYSAEQSDKKYKFGFMPHCLSSKYFDWSEICKNLNINYICAEWSVDKVLAEMSSCEIMICEAMHGAIVADALRIPWIPVRCYDYIFSFKWEDWLSTINLPYEPHSITSIYDHNSKLTFIPRIKNQVKRALYDSGYWNNKWFPPLIKDSPQHKISQAENELNNLTLSKPYLSSDSICQELTDRYLDLLNIIITKKFL